MPADARSKYEVVAVDKTSAALNSAKRGFSGLDKHLKTIAGAGAALFAGGVLGRAVSNFAKNTAADLDQIAKSAGRLGTTVEQLDALNFVVELGGGSATDLATAYRAASKTLVDFSFGTGEGAKAFESLNIEAENADGSLKSVERIILDVSDALPVLRTETERVAAVQRIFGKSGTQLLPVLRQGSAAIREQIAEGRSLSIRTAELAKKGEDFVDAQLRFGRATRAAKDALAVQFLPTISRVAEAISRKLVGAITGIREETRLFVADLKLESPSTQIALLEKKLAETQRRIPAVTLELGRMAETVRSGRMEVAHARDEDARTISDVRAELDLLRKDEKFYQRGIEEAKQQRERELEIEEQVRAERGALLDIQLEALDTQAANLESAAREKILREGIAASIKETAYDLDNIAGELKELENVELPAAPQMTEDALEKWGEYGDVVRNIGASIGTDLADEMDRFVRTGKTGADILGRVWTNAIAGILADLTELTARAAVLAGINALLGGGTFGASFRQFTGLSTSTAAPAAVTAAGAVTNNFYSLIPASTDDLIRANVSIQEAATRANRLAAF